MGKFSRLNTYQNLTRLPYLFNIYESLAPLTWYFFEFLFDISLDSVSRAGIWVLTSEKFNRHCIWWRGAVKYVQTIDDVMRNDDVASKDTSSFVISCDDVMLTSEYQPSLTWWVMTKYRQNDLVKSRIKSFRGREQWCQSIFKRLPSYGRVW